VVPVLDQRYTDKMSEENELSGKNKSMRKLFGPGIHGISGIFTYKRAVRQKGGQPSAGAIYKDQKKKVQKRMAGTSSPGHYIQQ